MLEAEMMSPLDSTLIRLYANVRDLPVEQQAVALATLTAVARLSPLASSHVHRVLTWGEPFNRETYDILHGAAKPIPEDK